MDAERIERRRAPPPARLAPVLLFLGFVAALRVPGPDQLPLAQAARRPVRVALGAERGLAQVTGAAGAWRLTDREDHVLLRGRGAERWGVERRGTRLRVLVEGGREGAWVDGPILWNAESEGQEAAWRDRHYHGNFMFAATDTGIVVINVLEVEDYLRGVVPLETGNRNAGEHAAVEAQAVAARSYTYQRMNGAGSRLWDLRASESDQVYGGVDAETALGNLAVDATAGVVLTYEGKPVFVPYHSVCGGSTAAPGEVWREGGAPYLRGVSDRMPGSERSWCDIAPRFRWERVYAGDALQAAVERYLRTYAADAPATTLGRVTAVQLNGLTPSGRAVAVTFTTERGAWRVRGNDARAVLRTVRGDLLPSTYFSLEPVVGRDGRLMQLTVRGTGNGHGVGMCQWGAIGRARAGHDFRAILQAYFPGTALARVS